MDICPRSLDHKGWEDEGVLNVVLEEMRKLYNDEDFKRKCKAKLKESVIEKAQFIMEHAPFTLLTTGWGLLEESTNNPNDVIKRNYEPMKKDSQNYKKIFYLIYKKRNRK